jgi:hypothetical protein
VKPRPSKKAAADGNGNEDDEAEAKTPASPERRLVLLKQALAECGRFNIFCKEKARWKYCADWWGKVPECPQANPGIQRQH